MLPNKGNCQKQTKGDLKNHTAISTNMQNFHSWLKKEVFTSIQWQKQITASS